MRQSNQVSGGFFSGLVGFLAIFFQVFAPSPTVNFTAEDGVFQSDRRDEAKLALTHEGPVAARKARVAKASKTSARRRLQDGEYVGEYLDVIA